MRPFVKIIWPLKHRHFLSLSADRWEQMLNTARDFRMGSPPPICPSTRNVSHLRDDAHDGYSEVMSLSPIIHVAAKSRRQEREGFEPRYQMYHKRLTVRFLVLGQSMGEFMLSTCCHNCTHVSLAKNRKRRPAGDCWRWMLTFLLWQRNSRRSSSSAAAGAKDEEEKERKRERERESDCTRRLASNTRTRHISTPCTTTGQDLATIGLVKAWGRCRLWSKVKYASICIARFTAKPQMRSDMDHTVLPANYTTPAFTPQPQNITALWLVLILPSQGG